MQLIEELEPVERGLYGGTIGYFGAQGDMDQAITIRTLVFEGDQYSYQAGAGIVSDSRPEAEYNESPRQERRAAQRARRSRRRDCEQARAAEAAADRQLRFLHLQPGAGLPGAGRARCA